MNALILVNPHSGNRKLAAKMDKAAARLEAAGHQVRLAETASPQEARALLAGDLQGADTVICCGGDGTLSETVGQVLNLGLSVDLGYIPGGTTNDFARFLHIPREPEAAAEFLLHTSPKPLDVGVFGEKKFIYVASFGAFTRSSYATHPKLKQALGHFAYVLESLRELPELRPVSLEVDTDEGEHFEGDFLFGAVSDSTSIGGVVKPDPATVDPADGRFELVLVRHPKNLGEFNHILGCLAAGRIDPKFIVYTHLSRAVVTSREPLPWSLDGEYAPGAPRQEVAVLPRAVRMYY